jgi:hypothetical protein
MARRPTRKILLNRAKAMTELLGPEGEHWAKGTMHGHRFQDGEYTDVFCLVGAQTEVTLKDSLEVRLALQNLLRDCVKTVAKDPNRTIIGFNDNHRRTFASIRKVLACVETDAAVWEPDDADV